MRKPFCLFITVCFFSFFCKAQYADIPDNAFREYLRQYYPACMNASGQLDTTCSQLLATTVIHISDPNIQSLEGIQYFKNLDTLEVRSCPSLTSMMYFPPALKYFDASTGSGNISSMGSFPATLKYLNIADIILLSSIPPLPNSLDYLNTTGTPCLSQSTILPASLTTLYCGGNDWLGALPALPASLEWLDCQEAVSLLSLPSLPATLRKLSLIGCRRIKNLPALPNSLQSINCQNCDSLQLLPALSATSLIYFNAGYCPSLTSIPSLPSTVRYIDCNSSTKLSALPALPDSLRSINCSNLPHLTNLPALPVLLDSITCYLDSLVSLPALNNSLQYLVCNRNKLSSLPALPPSLIKLLCSVNSISSLPPLPASLAFLECANNQLTSLPALPVTLTYLNANVNGLSSIPVLPPSLIYLYCSGNQLSLLPALPSPLIYLSCGNNQLTTLPALPPLLTSLTCSNNQLSSLPALPDTMRFLDCGFNDNLLCLPRLPRGGIRPESSSSYTIFELIIDPTKINCIPNIPNAWEFGIYDCRASGTFPINMPICNPLNNIHQCTAFPQLQGTIFIDNNSNGAQDANDQPRKNVKVLLSNGNYTFTDSAGHYEIGTDTTGAWAVSAVAPRYFDAAPSSYNYNFLRGDTLATGNFALQPNSTTDELTVIITPINHAARPGFSFPYMISYENTGNTTLSPTIVFDYDETALNYNTSSVAGVVDDVNTLSFNVGTFYPGQSGSFIGYFTLKTTVPIDDTLNSKATIAANAFAAYDSVQTIVTSAIDPNDKQATPQLSPLQVANGQYIDYTIRFQNTGTDTAFNIVLSDTLNDNLQAGSLQMLASSHHCKTTVKGDIVFFEFLNILLPDSNVNEKASHGFVSFKIKPQTTAQPNTTIPNKAAIYFDYNAPVITNTAGTLIKNFIVVPLRLVSFSAVPQNDNTTTLYWNTANEINTKQFTIEQSTDGIKFNSLRNIPAKEKAINDYSTNVPDASNSFVYYRLKIVDKDGTYSYSPIIKIDRRKNMAGFSVLTNPVKDFIIINTTDKNLNNTQASIINTNGAVVKSFMVKEGSQTIEVKGLPTGLYYLRTWNGSSRIIIQ